MATVLTGERRIVSVLIADVVNSTGIAERLGPERSKFLMDEVLRIMTEHVERYAGTVAQRAGDEIFAVFGAPVAHEDDSERAVRAALAIQRAIARYAGEVRDAYGVDLAVRVGVNTGPVVIASGNGDADLSERWNALGDTVNVASRLQELAPPGEVAVGPMTARQVDGWFELERLGEQALQGKAAPVTTYRVCGVRESERGVPAAEGPLVGRDFELTVLERAMDGLREGRGVILSVTGEAGIGKTRLAAEVRRRYDRDIHFVEGRAVSYAQTFPYSPIRDLLREWLGVGAATPETRVRLELKAQIAEVFGDQADEAYPFLASVLGLALEPDAAERIRELNRESIQHQTFEVFAELLCRLSSEQPLCVILEDLHWADESTLELLEETLRVTEEAAVGLVFLYRTERQHRSWRLGERARQLFPHRYREIELRPLPADASRALVGSTAEGNLPDSVADVLVERAGGNPFFLQEAFRDLVERGALRRVDGSWELAVRPDEVSVPALVQGAVQARLDRLDPSAREVLSLAAVIGRTFGLALLEELVPHARLLPALTELQRLDLVVETRRRPTPEYRFRHGLVQEVAYSTLVESTRKKLHKRVGEALERLQADSPEEVYDLLARHFSEADEAEKAVEYLLKAGDAARKLYADQEAIEHYARARSFLARMGDDRRARETLFKMALAHHLAFDFAKAEEVYDEAFSCRVEERPQPAPTERLTTAVLPPDELSPGDVYTTEGGQFVSHLFQGLLAVDRELNVVPVMADNMRVSSDGLTYLFRLREGARWSDGEPVTAEDFVFAWRSLREEEAITAFLLDDIAAAEALDDRTLEVRLHEPRSYFPYILASMWSFPRPKHKCEELGADWRKPENLVGNGPFTLRELTDEGAVLAANPHWPGERGNVGEVAIEFMRAKNREPVDEWKGGRFDVLQVSDPSIEEAPDTLATLVAELSVTYVGFRPDRPPFSNELVRKAFSHAIDREGLYGGPELLVRAASRGGAIPPAMPGHSHRIAPDYDPELARRLLADAGYPDGRGLPELRMIVGGTILAVPDVPEQLVEQWRELGARVTVNAEPIHLWASDMTEEQLWVSGWTADYPDPNGFFRGLFEATGWPFYTDDDIMELLTRARSLRDQGERMRLYHEVDRLWVAEHAAILPLFYGRTMLVRRPWVDGLWANPLTKLQLDQVIVRRDGA
ncbi:MAG TPA: ABC transporter substrate-binding protein [Gaiellaceae bacterium]|nr:ABC transporter substrate-binding protein [Gaiellaceae bacterium]